MDGVWVVTKAGCGRGNLRSAIGGVFLDPQAQGQGALAEPLPLGQALGQPLLDLYVQVPNFTLGELLVLDGAERDQLGRKPSKWEVELEWFATADEAAARAREVIAELFADSPD